MLNKYKGIFILTVFLLLCTLFTFPIKAFPDDVETSDVSNSKDHPLISRFPDSFIRYYENINYDEFKLPFHELKAENVDSEYKDKKIWIEGQITKHLYIVPEENSPLQIFRNYETAIKEEGFEIIAKDEREVPKGFSRRLYQQTNFKDSSETSFEGMDPREKDSRYLAAKMSGENGDVYLSVFISKHGFYGGNWPDGTPAVFQVIVEEKDLNTDLIETDKNFESSEVEIRDFPDNLPAEDISNSRDHPLISRFPGSYIRYYNQENYDEFKLPFQELNTENIDSEYKDEKIWLEGQLTQHLYIAPEDYSPLQIFRNYETAIKEAGFEIIAKNERKVPKGFSRRLYEQINFKDSDETSFEGIDSREENSRYIAAKMSGENGDVYLSVFISKHGFYGGNWPDGTPAVFQLIVEEKEMESDLIDAEKVFRKIESTGKASIQGVYFDYDSAKIKEKSEPTIKEIASLLDNNPDLELYVVGHTDNTGEFEYNMDLSQNRAKALVERLVSKYGIDSKRLEPAGIGPLAPAATNETKEGRSKNRRVELVKSN